MHNFLSTLHLLAACLFESTCVLFYYESITFFDSKGSEGAELSGKHNHLLKSRRNIKPLLPIVTTHRPCQGLIIFPLLQSVGLISNAGRPQASLCCPLSHPITGEGNTRLSLIEFVILSTRTNTHTHTHTCMHTRPHTDRHTQANNKEHILWITYVFHWIKQYEA